MHPLNPNEIIVFRKTKSNTLERLKSLINQVWLDPIQDWDKA